MSTTTTTRWDYTTAMRHDAATGRVCVDLDLLHPHPKNVRRELGDLKELTDSIRAQGILQPITVAPDPSGAAHFVLVFGHRRRAAGIMAPIAEVPVIVRPDLDTEAKVLEAMLAENVDREDLTAVEEGDGYRQLVLLDYTPNRIAKAVGRSLSTVRRRLALAALPDKARDALHAGQITLQEADEIAQVVKPDDTDAVKQLTAAVKVGSNELQLELARLRRRHEFEAKLQKQIDELGTHGVDKVFRIRRMSDLPAEWQRGRMIGYATGLSNFLSGLAAGEEKTPAAMIFEGWGVDSGYWYTAVPADPDPDPEPAAAGTPAAQAGSAGELPGQRSVEDELAAQREAQAQAEREQLLADLFSADGIREEWLRKLVTKRVDPVRVGTMLRQLVAQCGRDQIVDEAAADLAGLDPEIDWNDEVALRDHAASLSTPALVQLLWALVMLPEPSLYYDDGTRKAVAKEHLAALVELGYELTSVEAALIADAPAAADAGEDAGT